MIDPADRVVRAIAHRNSYALVWLQFGVSHLIALGGIGLLRLSQPMSTSELWTIIVVSQVLIAIDDLISIKLTRWMWRPVWAWEHGARDPASTIAAWTTLATLPLEYTRLMRRYPFFFVYLPFIAYTTWTLHLQWYSFFTLVVGGCVVLLYGLIARYFTISLELVVLVTRSLGRSLNELQHATERVRAGDYTARVPVVATDETGRLAQSFNTMVVGLHEREQLREAFGAYVDPGLAERVLREGPDLIGEQVDVTVLFLDIRDFTAFAERAEPAEVVTMLSGFWELVVPALLRHGGHANKFIGDGLLAVFGAPERLDDHAARAVTAALEITQLVRERYAGRVEVGIGVNSGPVIAGTVGGGGRVEFTVIGDAVNTAARVEAATRETGDDLLITDATRRLLDGAALELQERPPVALKGKRAPVDLWAPRVALPVAD